MLLAGLGQLLGRIESYVCFAGIQQHVHIFLVYFLAFALLVGAVGSAFAYAFVYAYAEPGQSLVDILLGSRHESLRVGVLDT